MPIKYDIEKLRSFVRSSGLFSSAAEVMGDFVLRCTGESALELYLAMVLTVQSSAEKHVCLKLDECAGTVLTSAVTPEDQLQLPELEDWLTALRQEPAAGVTAFAGDADQNKIASALLVIDENCGCYLQRQWSFECSISENLLRRANTFRNLPELPDGYLHKLINFFPTAEKHASPDYQQLAVAAALRRDLLVLSGGPGTGKTTVAAAILAGLLEQNIDLNIKLAAPTAKAAVRLLQSLKNNIKNLSSPQAVKDKLNTLESSTLHSLLGYWHNSHEFIYNSHNYLVCDILLIDECSMVSQSNMARTLEALHPECKLILLGDRYQLASVEAGAVMANICDGAEPNLLDSAAAEFFQKQTTWVVPAADGELLKKAPLSGALAELKENHRFAKSAKLLGTISAMIRDLGPSSDAESTARQIAESCGEEFEFKNLQTGELKDFLKNKFSEPRLPDGETFFDLPVLAASGKAEDRIKAFKLIDKLKMLSPAYDGARGIDKLNNFAMQLLGLELYTPGSILLIKRNDYRIDVVNGDIGLVAIDADRSVKVYFADKPTAYNIADLPEHEPAFAMSVHKSQGSGFAEVIFVMPEKAVELMTREMVYTAMTRAEEKLSCIGTAEVLAQALKKPTVRMSNLAMRLKKDQ